MPQVIKGAAFRYKNARDHTVFKAKTCSSSGVFTYFHRYSDARVGMAEGETRMTDVQKELIRAMRLQGIGYKAIARDLHLRRNQVQLYCKTHGLGGDGNLVRLNYVIWCEKTGHCLYCGTELKQPDRGRKKKFCSGKCRTAWCRAKQAEAEETETGGSDA